MRIGLQIPNFTYPTGPAELGSKLAEIARAADAGGFASVWVMDHFFQIESVGPADTDMLEGYSALSYLAALTERVRLGTMVTGVTYRHPGLLAKTVTTLDVLSGGRAILGIGAAWYEREHAGLGVPFPPIRERFERLEETLQIVLQMWSGDAKPYNGRHYHLAETLCVPQPLTRPHPPILIGGLGEQKTLRLVAQYADACNLFDAIGLDLLAHKIDVLKRHCDDVARPYDEIEKTCLSTVHLASGEQTPSQVIAHFRKLADMGFQQVIVNMPNVQDVNPIEILGAEVVPEIAAW
ncbi:MAG: LLM class F420-dependent oxidoreductase [Deltaproteobacteria bacterium]|nr:LLM class F420-dependent oxidoreductase [Deltaproteobacteria bacterium]